MDELSGLFLPEDFMASHANNSDVKGWSPEQRLKGKFGRFLLVLGGKNSSAPVTQEMLFMGTTVGLHGIDENDCLEELRHRDLQSGPSEFVRKSNLWDRFVDLVGLDYGATCIVLDDEGKPSELKISGRSIDFGRADTEGRAATCELFRQLLDGFVDVIDVDPEPSPNEYIIRPRHS